MANFTAEERNPSPSAKPGENKVPECDPDHMTYMGDGTVDGAHAGCRMVSR
jgi:hypothetical protein